MDTITPGTAFVMVAIRHFFIASSKNCIYARQSNNPIDESQSYCMCRKFECREDIHYKTQTGTSCEKCNSKAKLSATASVAQW